jgi:2',3'-cyclic-nucleotide 2'-phosphodiesterase
MNILCIGDIFAKPGRECLKAMLPTLIEEFAADFVIVNGENAAGGRGINTKVAEEFLTLPVNCYTSGNHIWQHAKDIAPFLSGERFLRPHNAPFGKPGKGCGVFESKSGVPVGVINLQGRVHMYEGDKHASPFEVGRSLATELRKKTPIIIADFHAEITAEKKALGYWLDGQVSCLYGTHTHIQTADAHILPQGTAYITDIGMTGAQDSVIGARSEDAIRRFLTDGKEKKWKPAEGDVQIQGIVLNIDEKNGKATHIEHFQRRAGYDIS